MGRLKRILFALLFLLAGYYALFGGEYSAFELRRIRRERAALEQEVDRLRRELDSLRAWADSLETDSATLERIARERFGMIREGEVLYRIAGPDSAKEERPPDTARSP